MYAGFFKRALDVIFSLFGILLLLPVFLLLAISGAFAMKGNPFFAQLRPGKKMPNGSEQFFLLLKFRSMDGKRDEEGRLLPDENRLNSYGRFLRKSSLDELPQLFNVLFGSMSLVGPRPQLPRDLVFMTEEQRRRHSVRPGITGLAQVKGRNSISWEQKLAYDLEYIDRGLSFANDGRILLESFGKALKGVDTVRKGTVSDTDLGDWLLAEGRITREEYQSKMSKVEEVERNRA